ncbi:MAG: lysostaphin resistance A-like protein [Candidatus Binatia bacterium]
MQCSIVWLAIVFEGGIVVLAWGLGWLLESPPFERVHLRWQSVAWGVVATFPPLLGMLWCTRSQWGPFPRLVREVEEKLGPWFADCSHVDFAVISMLAGLGEEALFRGVIQTTLADSVDPWVALLVASTLFGLGHCITPTYAVLTGLLGLYLGGISMNYENLLVAIVVHTLYDFVALVYLVRKLSAQQDSGLIRQELASGLAGKEKEDEDS